MIDRRGLLQLLGLAGASLAVPGCTVEMGPNGLVVTSFVGQAHSGETLREMFGRLGGTTPGTYGYRINDEDTPEGEVRSPEEIVLEDDDVVEFIPLAIIGVATVRPGETWEGAYQRALGNTNGTGYNVALINLEGSVVGGNREHEAWNTTAREGWQVVVFDPDAVFAA